MLENNFLSTVYLSDTIANIKKLSILYVDDDSSNRKNNIKVLEKLTDNLFITDSVNDAIKIFKDKNPHILIVQLMVAELQGIKIIEAIKKHSSTTPVIALVEENIDAKYLINIGDLFVTRFLHTPTNKENLTQIIIDISNQLFYEYELKSRNRLIQSLLDLNHAFVTVSDENELLYLNQSFLDYLRINNLREYKIKHPNGVTPYIIEPKIKLNSDKDLINWALINSMNTEPVSVKIKLSPFGNEDHNDFQSFLLKTVTIPDQQKRYLLTFTDVTQLEAEKQRYQYLAEYDPLTEIYNRSRIYQEIDKEIDRVLRYKQEFSILMVDLDHFKVVNDTYGHQVGDNILHELAQLIKVKIRNTDSVGRYGGEEFIVVMPYTVLNIATIIAERLRVSIENHQFSLKEHTIRCSIGVAEYVVGETKQEVIKRADDALYKAKNSGRNRVEASIPE